MIGIDAKRWAERADALQYTELQNVRSVAQNWRTGLTGLTSLLSVASIVVAPGLADRLEQPWRTVAGAITLAGLMALFYGTWQAMSAAFGVPGNTVRVSGEVLRQWESDTAKHGADALARARRGTLAGLLLIVVTTAVVLFASGPAKQPALLRIETTTETFCGHLAVSDKGYVEIVGDDGTAHKVQIAGTQSLRPVTAC